MKLGNVMQDVERSHSTDCHLGWHSMWYEKKLPIFWGNAVSNFWTPEVGNLQGQYELTLCIWLTWLHSVPDLPVSSSFKANILVSPTVHTFEHYMHIPVWNQIFNLICSLYCDQDRHILGGYELQWVPECHYFVHQAPCQAPNPSHGASGSQGCSQGSVEQNLQYLQETNYWSSIQHFLYLNITILKNSNTFSKTKG